MKRWALALLLPLGSGVLQAACLPTLGTDDCARSWDPLVQAIDHKYMDAPVREVRPKRARAARRPRTDN
jgi:hypothetical protein